MPEENFNGDDTIEAAKEIKSIEQFKLITIEETIGPGLSQIKAKQTIEGIRILSGITTVRLFLVLILIIIGASIGIWFFSRLHLEKIIQSIPEDMIDYQIKYSDLVDKTIALNRAFTDHFVSIFASCIGPLIPILSALIGYVWGQKSREDKEVDKDDMRDDIEI